MLKNSCVILGVTGGIAAYKSVEILRGLKKKEADVAVVMTANAKRFVAPLTFEALSGKPVADNLFSPSGEGRMEHLALARWANLVVIAPATANTIAKLAVGLADDLLSTLALATNAPLLVAPAMNTRMIRHPATEANLKTLRDRGVHIVDPETGALGSAEEEDGYGRLAAPETILRRATELLFPRRDLAGKRLLITAGPTREVLDPVRFLSNRSSGKMGLALARQALRRGAAVTLVCGPISIPPPQGAHVVPVVSADEMMAAVQEHLEASDAVIMTAAVADFRPTTAHPGKIKKGGREKMVLEMEATPDILLEISRKRGKRVLVGFAAETDNVTTEAKKKLLAKDLDLIVANDITVPGAGFESDTNQVEMITRSGRRIPVPLLPKEEVAERILDQVSGLLRREEAEDQ